MDRGIYCSFDETFETIVERIAFPPVDAETQARVDALLAEAEGNADGNVDVDEEGNPLSATQTSMKRVHSKASMGSKGSRTSMAPARAPQTQAVTKLKAEVYKDWVK